MKRDQADAFADVMTIASSFLSVELKITARCQVTAPSSRGNPIILLRFLISMATGVCSLIPKRDLLLPRQPSVAPIRRSAQVFIPSSFWPITKQPRACKVFRLATPQPPETRLSLCPSALVMIVPLKCVYQDGAETKWQLPPLAADQGRWQRLERLSRSQAMNDWPFVELTKGFNLRKKEMKRRDVVCCFR